MKIEIDDRLIRQKYEEYIHMLSNHPDHYINLKHFQIRDVFGDSMRPDMFIQLIVSLVEENMVITEENNMKHKMGYGKEL